ESKEEIVLEAMSVLETEIDAGLVDTGDALDDLEAFFRHRAAFVGADDSIGRLIFSEELIHLAGDAGRQRVAQWRARSVAYLGDRLRRLHAEGKLRADLDLAGMGLLVQGVLLTFAMQAALGRSGTREALLARVEHGWQTLRAALLT